MKNVLITSVGCAPASAIARSIYDHYNIIGIDKKELCVGNFVCHTFISLIDMFNSEEYWNHINEIVSSHEISGIFVTLPLECEAWSMKKNEFKCKYNCDIFLNSPEFCNLCNNKELTYDFCIQNDINIPPKMSVTERPIVIKEKYLGCGSVGIQILKTNNEHHHQFDSSNTIIQQFIDGDEYTCDVISSPVGNVVNIIPKKRCFVKNGQSYISKIVKDTKIIEFVEDVCNKIGNKCAINVQVIKERDTNKIYLVEINPRFATTIMLSIKAGVHIPRMLIENDYITKEVEDGITMVRDYKEYFKTDIISKQKIFLTGGAGFIGSNILEQILTDTTHDVTIYDDLSSVNCGLENIQVFLDNSRVKFIKGDILDKELLIESMCGHDIVIHMAAQLEVTTAYENPLHDLNINLIGTINVIEGCVKHKINRLINASSACIYGFTQGSASKEDDRHNPNWEYGVTKLAAEKYIQIASNTHGIHYTSLRFSIVYGKHEWFGRVLTIFTRRAIEGKDLVIFGDGCQTRDYINVYDAANFVLECLTNKNTYNKTYNVSSGQATSLLQLADKIKTHFPNIGIVFDDVKEGEVSKLVEGRERLNQELRHLYLDNSKAFKETTWRPRVNLDEGISNYIMWAKTNLKNWMRYKV